MTEFNLPPALALGVLIGVAGAYNRGLIKKTSDIPELVSEALHFAETGFLQKIII
ncbi:hypothetical protein H8L32_14515 [Undibacterium sp. CY18W]|uniref:Uncharacterized protein n=1 Tax=Undibacterium hunanense TaxID=2762292 RepID=A0ABR6ZSW3_9BURK|nr:hypothetical protein [Undibacterium hunanense]MBC3918704.1 hypothetical protein [Undibacterium hunanense]